MCKVRRKLDANEKLGVAEEGGQTLESTNRKQKREICGNCNYSRENCLSNLAGTSKKSTFLNAAVLKGDEVAV